MRNTRKNRKKQNRIKKRIRRTLQIMVIGFGIGCFIFGIITSEGGNASGTNYASESGQDTRGEYEDAGKPEPDCAEKEPPNLENLEFDEAAKLTGHLVQEYPEELIELYGKNKEARQFVMDYPEKKDTEGEIDFSGYQGAQSVPLFIQWDARWGYHYYAGNVMGLTGCGPTCLSMVAVYLTGNTDMNPRWMADFSMGNGFYENGHGTKWSFMTEGARRLGMNSKEITVNEERMSSNLIVGNPIICIMGPGDFTDSGHFIVLTGYENGAFTLNDPNSRANSERTWTFEELKGQIRNLWVLW